MSIEPNVKESVPFFFVSNIEVSVRYYVDGLGFQMTKQWIDKGKLRWCWLQYGGAALMLQEFRTVPEGKLGLGVSLNFTCDDALSIYREITARGIVVKRPFVGNGMWVVAMLDPDGYNLSFESLTDVAEETELAE